MSTYKQLIDIITNVLSLNLNSSNALNLDSPLLGAIPEFDSMAVVNVISALEERFGFAVEDDEIDASVFETIGSLVAFVESKL